MKKQMFAVFVVLLLSAACKKDSQVLSTLSELDSFTAQIMEKIETASDPAAGVDAAHAYFNENQAALRERMKALGTLRGYQVSSEVRQKMEQSLTNNIGKVYGLKIKMMPATFQNKDLDAKLNQLVDDYTALVKGEAPRASAGESNSAGSAEASPKEKAAAEPAVGDPAQLREQLLAVLGDDSSWKSTAMTSLHANMTCNEVRGVFTDLE